MKMVLAKQHLTFFIVCFLFGCVSPAALRDQESRATFEAAKAYCDELMRDSALDPLRHRATIIGSSPPTFQMLAYEATVSIEEKPLVAIWGDSQIKCQEKWLMGMRQFAHALVVANYQSMYAAANSLRSDLYNGRVTWGEYNRARQKLLAQSQAANAEITSALARQDQQMALARQQAAAADYANFLQSQRNLILQQPQLQQPTNLNCTSQTIGGITTTSCH